MGDHNSFHFRFSYIPFLAIHGDAKTPGVVTPSRCHLLQNAQNQCLRGGSCHRTQADGIADHVSLREPALAVMIMVNNGI